MAFFREDHVNRFSSTNILENIQIGNIQIKQIVFKNICIYTYTYFHTVKINDKKQAMDYESYMGWLEVRNIKGQI